MANALTKLKTDALADDAVTLAKQAAGTDGQIITYDASGNPTAVGPGTDGQVLTSTGAGSPPAFEALPASNNYTHPNHSGEVTSTADGAQVIADDVVDEANLKVSNSPTNGYFLSAQSGNTGGLTWAAAGGGKVLQWKSITRDGNQRVTNNDKDTWTDGNIPLAITPASTDSRILIMLNLHVGLYYGTAGYQSKPGNNIGIKIYKTVGGTDTDIQADGADASGFYTYRMSQDSTTDQSDVWSFKTGYIARSIIHHPNTTSEVTFKVAIKSGFDGNTVACNDSSLSTLVLLELENNS